MGGSGDSRYNPPPPTRPASSPPGTGGSGGDVDDPCGRLRFSTTLDSPDPGVVDDLEEGDRLDVVLADDEGTPIVEARTADEAVAGTITSELADLIPCLQAGRAFVAVVRSVDGGAVGVDIFPAP